VNLLRLFGDNLLPVFLAAGAGYLLAARLHIDPRPLSRAAFHIFAPCLIYQVIVDGRLPGDAALRMAGFTGTCLLGLALIAFVVARALRWSRPTTAAVVLVVMLPNAGNFGLSACLFAFGEAGLAHASLFFVTSAIMTFTVGVFVASLGRTGIVGSLIGLLKLPTIWAVVVAFATLGSDLNVPLPIGRTIELLSGATIPVFLVVLGMQLHGKGWGGPFRPLALSTALRLLAAPGLALILAPLFGLQGAAHQAGVLQAAMPSAVICIVLATEYDVEPALVTSTVFVTTLLSPLTLTPLLVWLGA
jgi:predicted permease